MTTTRPPSPPDPRHETEDRARVLVIHWGQNGGGPLFALRMTEALLETQAAEIFVSFNRDADLAPSLDALGCPAFVVSTYRSTKGVLTGLPRLLRTSVALRRYITRHEIGVVFSPFESIWQSLASILYIPRGVRYVNSVHDGAFHPGHDGPVRRILRRLDFSRTDHIVTYSSTVADALRGQGVTVDITASVLPAWQPTAAGVRTLLPEHTPRVGLFGAIRPYKGVDTFVEVARMFEQAQRKVHFAILGDGPAELLPTLRPDNLVVERRWVPDADLLAELDAFDVLVLPYTEASQSGIYAWAVALGIPVIATPVGGLIEQVADTGGGLVAAEATAGAVADELSRLLSDPELYRELSQAGLRAAAGSHSWSRTARDVVGTFA